MSTIQDGSLFPGKSILGVMGSGQLGRMFAQKAIERGYTVHCYSPDSNSPAGKVGVIETVGEYTDSTNLRKFLSKIDALTFEFENIPMEALDTIEKYSLETGLTVSPSVESIRISQNRFKEKEFFRSHGLKTTSYIYIDSLESLYLNQKRIKFPSILKTNQFGYDGKGQSKFENFAELEKYIMTLSNINHVLENVINFSCEISIVASRFKSGKVLFYPPSENIHKNHILDISIHPASVNDSIQKQAIDAAKKLLQALDYVGVLAVEFFVSQDSVICNEFAPRPHNSGHFSMDACSVSQFELQLLALCNIELNLEKIETIHCVMKNILGFDLENKTELFHSYLTSQHYKLHLYQKENTKVGRKMGHWNYLGEKSFLDAFTE